MPQPPALLACECFFCALFALCGVHATINGVSHSLMVATLYGGSAEYLCRDMPMRMRMGTAIPVLVTTIWARAFQRGMARCVTLPVRPPDAHVRTRVRTRLYAQVCTHADASVYTQTRGLHSD